MSFQGPASHKDLRLLRPHAQSLKKSSLSWIYLCGGLFDAEELRAINLGKSLSLSRAWRPLQFERIADVGDSRVWINLDSPSVNCLSALLLDGSKILQVSRRLKSDFLAKFTQRGRQQFLVSLRFPFGDAPSTDFFVSPKGPTRMHQKYLKSITPPLENHDSSASLGH